jgi:SEC-C motif domain protein
MTSLSMCLCQSGKKHIVCCEPFILGKSYPESVESLMRSRYVAYNIGEFDYIRATCAEDALVLFDINDDMQKLNGVRLDVLSVMQNQLDGEVVFKAYYEKQGRIFYIHEHSFFKKIDNKWLYVSGKLLS